MCDILQVFVQWVNLIFVDVVTQESKQTYFLGVLFVTQTSRLLELSVRVGVMTNLSALGLVGEESKRTVTLTIVFAFTLTKRSSCGRIVTAFVG